MARTPAALVALLASALVAVPVTGAEAGTPSPDPLSRLDRDSSATLVVERRDDGSVRMVRARGGRALLAAQRGDARSATAATFAHRYGGALRRTGGEPDLRPFHGTHRFQQYVDGLPVVAGEATVALSRAGAPLALTGELADDTRLPDRRVTDDAAREIARAVLARATGGRATAEAGALWAFDPALVGEGNGPVRPVWRVRVAAGNQAEDVLVDAVTGAVALRIPLVEGAGARVCDAGNVVRASAVCSSTNAVRETGEPPSGNVQVDQAHDGITGAIGVWGAAGRDLEETIGTGSAGARVVESWVRWCDDPSDCPMDNAFWDGTRIHLGDGYAAANDVVAHELTHGVIERTANLMYLHESGAMNESIADVFGELADQQVTSDGDDDWLLGEATAGGAIRSMSNPPLYGQPDRVASPAWGTGDIYSDGGEVHRNSGVGNKTAWLLAHGGTFNGRTVSSIDGDDPTHGTSLRLWSGALDLLTSGSEYADLANALEATCDQLAAAAAPGFTSATCVDVRTAAAATELRTPAANAAGEAPSACAVGEVRKVLLRDDDTHHPAWVRTGAGENMSGARVPLWSQDPSTFGLPPYAAEGKTSWFTPDPDPAAYGDDATATLTATSAVTVPTAGRTFLHFRHAYALDYEAGTYYDGGRVAMLTAQNGVWSPTTTALPWVNGPTRTLAPGASGTGPAFGGDSRGWGSSRVELTALAGKAVKPRFSMVADRELAMLGWSVDAIEMYTCGPATATAVGSLAPHGSALGTSLSWNAPAWSGAGITSYRVRRSDGNVRSYPSTSRSATYPTLPSGSVFTFTVQAIGPHGEVGASATTKVVRTRSGLSTSSSRVIKGRSVTLSAKLVRADSGAAVGGRSMVFQRRLVGSTSWTTVGTRSTSSTGIARLSVTMKAAADFRVRFAGSGPWVGSASSTRRVTVR